MAAEAAQTLNSDPIETVILERLLRFYDPFSALGLKPPTLEEVERLAPSAHVPERRRSRRYHRPRIAYFVKQLREGAEVEPVWIDNLCWHGVITTTPIVTDGHHRFAAFVLLKRETMPASCSGRVDVIDWLTGRALLHPEDA